MHQQRHQNGIRGPTGPDKANDRAGNAAVRETNWSGSGTNQPSRVPRYILLAPAPSVGGERSNVKVSACPRVRVVVHGHPLRRSVTARHAGHADWCGTAGGPARRAIAPASPCRAGRRTPTINDQESGTPSDER